MSNDPDGELWSWGARALADAIRERRVSSREVVDAHLDRIAQIGDDLNALTVVLADEARAQADAADAALERGDAVGPLHGVPMTVKENVDVEGSATTQGVVAMKDAVPALDAPHVIQLRAAGAIPIGRTNLPDFGLRWHTDNALRGPTRNPWDPARTPGGSSGGDAAALAAGLTPLGNGNDYGGSLRVPSQFCGTCALRPTLGRVAQASALAPTDPPTTLQLFAVQGPMARRVEDLRVAFGAMTGADPRDPWWTPAPLTGPPQARRVAMTIDPAGAGVDPDVAAGVRRAGDALRDAGYEVEEVEPPAVERAARLWLELVFADLRTAMLPLTRPMLGPDALRFLDLALSLAPEADLLAYQAGFAARQAVARDWARFQAEFPLILGPVCTRPAFEVGLDLEGRDSVAEILEAMRLVVAVNLLGLPAAAVPTGVAHGLPQGVQVIGGRFREDACLDAADAIEARLGTLAPIDPRPSSAGP